MCLGGASQEDRAYAQRWKAGYAALEAAYQAGELDTEAEIIAALNATNTMLNLVRTALINLGLTASS